MVSENFSLLFYSLFKYQIKLINFITTIFNISNKKSLIVTFSYRSIWNTNLAQIINLILETQNFLQNSFSLLSRFVLYCKILSFNFLRLYFLFELRFTLTFYLRVVSAVCIYTYYFLKNIIYMYIWNFFDNAVSDDKVDKTNHICLMKCYMIIRSKKCNN